MGWVSGLAVYGIIWWLVIFMVLPWGARPIDDADAELGHAPGAPKNPRMMLKMAVTTVISGVIWGGVYMVLESGMISFREPY